MCGIAALFAYHSDAPDVQERELNRIRDHMRVRGPDGEGSWFDTRRRVGLGHRRLAIIDLSPGGAQPMHYPECELTITFNGEIYNYMELRIDLEKKGHQFRSQSDTEVLLHLYAEHGREMLTKLRGMYAFVIWDNKKQELFLARDPFGIKPLYYSDNGKTFRAASQVKALLAGGGIDLTPSSAGHVGYFLWGHLPDPYTLYKNIRALPAGSSMTVTREGIGKIKSFCSISDILANAKDGRLKMEDRSSDLPSSNSQLLRATLLDSVRHHLIADVPVGVFLSAGMDSTTLAALASELGSDLRTVTLAFEEFKGTADDETPLAEEVARHYGAKHQTIRVTRKDFENDLQHLLDSMDQPTNDGVNSFFISKAAAQAGLKVALSGLGGDELFGGYPSFTQIPRMVNAVRPFQSIPAFNRSVRIVSAPILKRFTSPKYGGLLEYGGTYGGAYLLRRGMFMPWELPELLDGEMVREGWNELQPMLRLDDTTKKIDSPHLKISALEMNWYMRNQLLRDTDWAGMAHSLEIRTPLVDVNLLSQLSPLLASEQRPGKRDMALTPNSQLPASILNRPKTGFTVPVRDWLLHAFDPSAGRERGLRGWAREVYSMFADDIPLHRASRKRVRARASRVAAEKGSTGKMGSTGHWPVPSGDPPLGTEKPHEPFLESVSRSKVLSDPSGQRPDGTGGSPVLPIRRDGTGGSPVLPFPHQKKLRALVLLTDGFGGFGGIAKFNRDFLSALCSHPQIEEVIALPRLMPATSDTIPTRLTHDTSALGGKGRYMKAVINNARKLRNGNSDTESLIICAHINLLPAALLARRISSSSLYLTVYGIDAWKPSRNPLTNACVRRVDGFISISNHTKRRFMRWSKLRDDEGMILPCCVDLSAFSPGPKPEALLDRYNLHGRKVIMTLGRLASEERYKGFDEVIEVLSQLGKQIPHLAYLICGDGPDRARLVEKAKSLGLHVQQHDGKSREQKTENRNSKMDISGSRPSSISSKNPTPQLSGESPDKSDRVGRAPQTSGGEVSNPPSSISHLPSSGRSDTPLVIFAGKISEEEKADHYRLADLYVMPSTGEGFGIVFLEALASGLPVIGSKADASREALMGGRLGALVDPRDPEDIVSTILRVLNQPEDQSRKTQNLDSVDYFSAARFEQRVHQIIDTISE